MCRERDIAVNEVFTKKFKAKIYKVLATFEKSKQVYNILTTDYYVSKDRLKDYINKDNPAKVLKVEVISVTSKTIEQSFTTDF